MLILIIRYRGLNNILYDYIYLLKTSNCGFIVMSGFDLILYWVTYDYSFFQIFH